MATIEAARAIDGDKLNAFVFRAVEEVGATLNAALVVMGDKLGLYRALAGAGPLDAGRARRRAPASRERYVREWLNAQAAGGYVEYDPGSGRYTLPPEQAVALTDADSPAYLPGVFQIALGSVIDSPRITEAARSGDGRRLARARPRRVRGLRAVLPARLQREPRPGLAAGARRRRRASSSAGAAVADVGCGHGASTILMAQAFPSSTFVGSDYHAGSIETARERARGGRRRRPGRLPRRRRPPAYPGSGYDLVTMFDCLHDMGDPVGAARHVREIARAGRHVDDRRADAPATASRTTSTRSAARTTGSRRCCAPRRRCRRRSGSRSAPRPARRASATSSTAGGFTRFRRVAETPFNLVFEARP